MEGVGVVIPVRHAGNDAILLFIDLHEPAGQPLRGGGQQGEVQVALFALLVHSGPHVADDLQAQHSGPLALAVVLANERLQRLRQADEAHGQGAVLQHLPDLVVPVQLVRVDPDALAHQEGGVLHFLSALELKALHELVDAQVDHPVQALEEEVDVPLGLDAQPGQIDGGKGEVAPPVADLAVGVHHVPDHAGAAAHVGDLRLRVALFIILQVKGRVHKREVGEEPLGRAADGKLEQVIVRLTGVVVHALFHPEDLDGEDGRLPVAQPGFRGQQDVFHDHPALRAGVHAVVDGGEGCLGAGAGVHGVQVVDECLHGLVGGPVGLLHGPVVGKALALAHLGLVLAVMFQQEGQLSVKIGLAVLQLGVQAGVGLQLLDVGLDLAFGVGLVLQQHHGAGQVLAVDALKSLPHADGHGVIKVHDGLAAVLVVLVGLDGDAGQSRIGGDVVRLPQRPVPRGKAPVKELDEVDLGAGGGAHGRKIHVMDVDVAVGVGAGVLRVHDEHLVELLRALAAILQHGAHGGVAVDVGVLALDVAVLGGGEGDVLIDLHEAGVHLSGAAALGAIEDVGLGRLHIAVVHQHPLHDVLDVLHVGAGAALHLQHRSHFVGQLGSSVVVAGFIGGLKGFVDRVGDLILMEGDHSTVPFPYLLYRGHEALRSFSHFLKFANKIPSSTGYLVVCLKRKHIILCLLFFSTHMIAPVASSVKS